LKSPGLKATFLAVFCAALCLPVMFGRAVNQPAAPAANLSASKSLGSPAAPITMEVFADFQCPVCRLFYMTVEQQVIENYVKTGKVYLVHHDFPLNMHAHSQEAARWANAAAIAGKFEIAERALYETQDAWAPTGQIEQALAGAFSPADLKKIRDIQSAQSAQIDAAILADMALGYSRNVNSTPTIFVTRRGQTNLVPTAGMSYDLLKQYLDYLLQH
jgi:protein-disulfide isomerase